MSDPVATDPVIRRRTTGGLLLTLQALSLCTSILLGVQARAQSLENLVRGGSRPESALAGVATAFARPIGHDYETAGEAKGCAHFKPESNLCTMAMTPDTVLRVASISKLVTAIAVMQLVEQGKIELDRDASHYLGFVLRNPAFPATPITVAQLLAHNSSIRDGEVYWAAQPYALRDFFTPGSPLWDKGAHFDHDIGPGQQFVYTNLNYGILGTIVERVSGERFDRYMQQYIFSPLQIAAGYNWSGLEKLPVARRGTVYRFDARTNTWQASIDDFHNGPPRVEVRSLKEGIESLAPVASDYKIGSNGTLFSPQGGLRISVRGLVRLGTMLAGCGRVDDVRILKCETVNNMLTPHWRLEPNGLNGDSEGGFYTSFGLGVHLVSWRQHPRVFPGHFGDAYGLRSGLLIDPDTRSVGAYIINGFASDPAKLAGDVAGFSTAEIILIDSIIKRMDESPKQP